MNNFSIEQLQYMAVELLKQLIATPSFSKQEQDAVCIVKEFFNKYNVTCHQYLNNLWSINLHHDYSKPTLLLNSHLDTVQPNQAYTNNPFEPIVKDNKLFGLGSNDAGGCLVSLIACFLHFYHQKNLPFNIVFAASAEEEISGKNGIEALLNQLPNVDVAIVGEPTLLNLAIAERGLMVIDAVAKGKAGHAARNEGVNAIQIAMDDITKLHQHLFPRVSTLLGPVQSTVTVIQTANQQHNVIPDECRFVIDVRVNELYTFQEVLAVLRKHLKSELQPRSTRLKSSIIPLEHPLVQAGLALGKTYYGSPTTSDKALMPFAALKMGPGDSARSHTADEFIYLQEIYDGVETYIQLLNLFFKTGV